MVLSAAAESWLFFISRTQEFMVLDPGFRVKMGRRPFREGVGPKAFQGRLRTMAWILWAHDVGAYGVGSQDLGLRWAEGLLGRELGRRPMRGGVCQETSDRCSFGHYRQLLETGTR